MNQQHKIYSCPQQPRTLNTYKQILINPLKNEVNIKQLKQDNFPNSQSNTIQQQQNEISKNNTFLKTFISPHQTLNKKKIPQNQKKLDEVLENYYNGSNQKHQNGHIQNNEVEAQFQEEKKIKDHSQQTQSNQSQNQTEKANSAYIPHQTSQVNNIVIYSYSQNIPTLINSTQQWQQQTQLVQSQNIVIPQGSLILTPTQQIFSKSQSHRQQNHIIMSQPFVVPANNQASIHQSPFCSPFTSPFMTIRTPGQSNRVSPYEIVDPVEKKIMKYLVYDIGVQKIDPIIKEEQFYDNQKKIVNEKRKKNKFFSGVLEINNNKQKQNSEDGSQKTSNSMQLGGSALFQKRMSQKNQNIQITNTISKNLVSLVVNKQ